MNRLMCCGLGLVLALVAEIAVAQQRVGKVEYAQGLATAQQKGADARFITGGEPLLEGDLITTTDKGYAVLALEDGTKVTLRPGTAFQIEQFAHGQGTESALLRLLKGGMRTITGLIGKRNPGGVRVSSVIATIGIRGTSFDARLCGSDCRDEQRGNRPQPGQGAPVPAPDTVVGRIVRISGEASAVQAGGTPRRLADGAPVLVGDEILTGRQATVVIAFRDQSKVSLEPQTRFRVDAFSYGKAGASDNFAMRLLKGGLRAFTGLIGKKNPAAVSVSTVVATIGVRGTGMDINCEGPCAATPQPANEACKPAAKVKGRRSDPACPDGLFVHTWDGKIFIGGAGKDLEVGLGEAGFAGAEKQSRLLAGVPDFMQAFISPRPDGVQVDWQSLFGSTAYSGDDGLYALVRDGFIVLEASGGSLNLGPGEGGLVGLDGVPHRLAPLPSFLVDDPFPAPENFNSSDPFILQLFGATMGNPGQEVCELQ